MNLTYTQKKQMQKALQDKGFYHGKIDGQIGPKSRAAIVAFKKSIGYKPRPYVGPLTWAALMEGKNVVPARVGGRKLPHWLRTAMTYRGLREYRGSSHNKTILKWWKAIGLGGIKDDETAWCAAYVGGVLVESGLTSTKSGLARSYDKWGRKLSKPAVGAVVTFWRSSPSSWKGHVGFVVGKDQHGRLMVLGGNQGDAVNIRAFSSSRVVGYYWPENTPENPSYNLPVVTSDGTVSTNEA